MLFVTFHGGKAGKTNIYAYASGKGASNTPVSSQVLSPAPPDVSELRGMVLAPPLLYVANGSKDVSNVLTYQGSGTTYTLSNTLISNRLASINHPFAMAFDDAGHCFVSNQDTNVVAILDVATGGQTASGGPISNYLQELKVKGTFLPSTFVASETGNLPKAPGTPTLPSGFGGLDVSLGGKGKTKKKVRNSVRDVAFSNGLLFVVDEPGGCIRMYHSTSGKYYGKNGGGPMKSPTHIRIRDGLMYVAADKEIWSSKLPKTGSKKPKLTFNTVVKVTQGKISGIAFDQENPPNSYVAIRTGTPQILMGGSNFENLKPLITGLPDSPEFLTYIPDK